MADTDVAPSDHRTSDAYRPRTRADWHARLRARTAMLHAELARKRTYPERIAELQADIDWLLDHRPPA